MGTIVYNQNIPQATDQISQSQPLILENFQGINTLVAIDHATFASANAGWHNQVTFVQQSTDSTTTLTQFALYNKGVGTSPVVPTMFLRQPNNGSAIDITTIHIAGDSTGGWSYTLSGLVWVWGTRTFNAGSTSQTFNYPTGFAGFSATYAQILTPSSFATDPNAILYANSFGAGTTFTVNGYQRTSASTSPATNFQFNFAVLGK